MLGVCIMVFFVILEVISQNSSQVIQQYVYITNNYCSLERDDDGSKHDRLEKEDKTYFVIRATIKNYPSFSKHKFQKEQYLLINIMLNGP